MYYAAIALTVAANVGYHIFQKSIRPEASPAISLVITYAVALLVSAVLVPVLGSPRSLSAALAQTNWASYALGVAIVGLEIGFLLAYRAGWDIGLAAPYSNVAVAVVLLPIGALAFGDQLTLRKLAGFGLAVAGLVLLSTGPAGTAPSEPAAAADPPSP